ncbi:MAG: hypothetical protein KY456_00755 [Chloroflexi bacterium]|nr:hypothetical protein [Chloroflexota bacterium]
MSRTRDYRFMFSVEIIGAMLTPVKMDRLPHASHACGNGYGTILPGFRLTNGTLGARRTSFVVVAGLDQLCQAKP